MIGSQTELYLQSHLDVQSKTPGAVTSDAFAEYLRCYDASSIYAICEDYWASVTVDRQQSQEDRAKGQKARQLLFAVWGGKGTVGSLFDVLGLWRQEADEVQGQALPCGHLIPEEDLDGLMKALATSLES